jgi:hypothetical protein
MSPVKLGFYLIFHIIKEIKIKEKGIAIIVKISHIFFLQEKS